MGKLPNDKQAHKNVHQAEIGGSANLQNICLLIHILHILFQHIFYEQKQICICHFVNWGRYDKVLSNLFSTYCKLASTITRLD